MRSNSKSETSLVTREARTEQKLPGLQGPLTARQALQAILPAIREIDSEFTLTFVGAGEDINHEGLAMTWDFFFDFPRRRAYATAWVGLCPDAEEEGPWCRDVHIRPKREGEPLKPALPLDFQDSPEAVRSLGEQGADWITGDGHMTLSTRILPGGNVVWHTYCWNKLYQTPFAAGK